MLFTLTSVARWSLGKLSLSRRSLQRVQSISQPANPAPASTANGSGASPAATVQSPPSAAQAAYSPTSRRGRTRSESQLPTGRPLVGAVSTNDGLASSAKNIGTLVDKKNVYFVPFRQDDPAKKPTSLVADFSQVEDTIDAALAGRQLQPVLLGPPA